MATQTITTQMVQIFHQNGLTRKHPSFFGQALSSQPSVRDATPQAAMLRAFGAAGLTVAEPTCFGIPHVGYVNQSFISPQPNAMRAQEPRTFRMSKRVPQAA